MPSPLSVGDCIQIANTLVAIIQAVDEATGAKHDYQVLLRETQFTSALLSHIENLRLPPSQARFKTLLATIVNECQDAITKFLERNSKYNGALGSSTLQGQDVEQGSGVRFHLKQKARMIQWSLVKKNDVSFLRNQLRSHTSLINGVLAAVHLDEDILSKIENIQAALATQCGALKIRLESSNQAQQSQEQVLVSKLEALDMHQLSRHDDLLSRLNSSRHKHASRFDVLISRFDALEKAQTARLRDTVLQFQNLAFKQEASRSEITARLGELATSISRVLDVSETIKLTKNVPESTDSMFDAGLGYDSGLLDQIQDPRALEIAHRLERLGCTVVRALDNVTSNLQALEREQRNLACRLEQEERDRQRDLDKERRRREGEFTFRRRHDVLPNLQGQPNGEEHLIRQRSPMRELEDHPAPPEIEVTPAREIRQGGERTLPDSDSGLHPEQRSPEGRNNNSRWKDLAIVGLATGYSSNLLSGYLWGRPAAYSTGLPPPSSSSRRARTSRRRQRMLAPKKPPSRSLQVVGDPHSRNVFSAESLGCSVNYVDEANEIRDHDTCYCGDDSFRHWIHGFDHYFDYDRDTDEAGPDVTRTLSQEAMTQLQRAQETIGVGEQFSTILAPSTSYEDIHLLLIDPMMGGFD